MGCATMPRQRFSQLVLAFLVISLATSALPAGDGVKKELKKHQGTWTVISSTFEGQQAGEDVLRSISRIVNDDHVVWKRNGKQFAGTKIELDPRPEPKAIDVIPDGGPDRGQHVLGIYKLEGDELTICMAAAGQPRPKEFEAKEGSKCTLRKFRREKAPAKP